MAFSGSGFTRLVAHLVEVEERWRETVEELFSDPSLEREQISRALQEYIAHMDEFIASGNASEVDNQNLPFVTIGSEVELLDVQDQQVYTYRVELPHRVEGPNCVSCLSPMGQSLLLKPRESAAAVEAPGGTFRYMIRAIRIP